MKTFIREKLSAIFPQLDPTHYAKQLRGKEPAEVFATIYKKNVWGGRLNREYHSGSGSRRSFIVGPYIEAVSTYLDKLGKPTMVDLGCGDFHVGHLLLGHTSHCIACDIVPDLMDFNRKMYRNSNVEFRTLDAITTELPHAEIVLVRQVLQHLSNAQVGAILPKLSRYRVAIITEHIPGFSGFAANLDKDTGPDHRVSFGSGLVLTEPPFNFRANKIETLCEVREHGGIIRTQAFEF